MITVIETAKFGYRGRNEKHTLCPHCNMTMYVWQLTRQRCPWCQKRVIDAALIATSENARIAYHLRGEY